MKYKIGELVKLSAAGRKLDHNEGFQEGYGMVIEYRNWERFPYKMRWFGSEHKHETFEAKEYELKRYRVKK
jgi:hypothetical protein